MRPGGSYRSQRKKAAREAGISLQQLNANIDRNIREQEQASADARQRLGIWARNGGRDTAVSPAIQNEQIAAMNAMAGGEAAIAEKIKLEDIDKAMERLLSKWQEDQNVDPLPLSKLFAARARQLGWVEGVEFAEDRP